MWREHPQQAQTTSRSTRGMQRHRRMAWRRLPRRHKRKAGYKIGQAGDLRIARQITDLHYDGDAAGDAINGRWRGARRQPERLNRDRSMALWRDIRQGM